MQILLVLGMLHEEVLLSRQSWESTGRFSAVPDASSDESKAERLSRYSELRWTIDAISTLNSHEALSGRSGVGWSC
jgi:hypothetical protein